MSLAAEVMFVLFFIWTFIGMPLGYAMLASGIVYFLITGRDVGLVASQSLNGIYGDFVMLAVPLFIFSAELMNAGEMTDKMFGFASLLVGRFRGGLAHVNIIASVIDHDELAGAEAQGLRTGDAEREEPVGIVLHRDNGLRIDIGRNRESQRPGVGGVERGCGVHQIQPSGATFGRWRQTFSCAPGPFRSRRARHTPKR